ncbi:MAG: sulfatase-like hydrolase/transferase [Gemmatimonadales bacterium]|nr:sulfatase-like hydrolase/transferase [Gemmatimonadales bacterium]
MSDNPFQDMTRKREWSARLGRWRDEILRPFRPSRIDPGRPGGPNLLLLGIDTLRYDHLGLAGYGSPASPNLDRLAASGTIFTDVTAPAPWTLPSFASALTGVMPGLHGGYLPGPLRNMDNQPPRRLDPDLPTMASILRKKGYRTAAFYSNQFFAFGLAESFDHHSYHNLPAAELARLALEWIRRHADQPFFCFVLFNDPHEPTTPQGEDLAPFLPRAAAAGAKTDNRTIRAFARWGEKGEPNLGSSPDRNDPNNSNNPDFRAGLALKLAIYDATIMAVDRTIGNMQEKLQAWNLADRTLVSVFSDHGEEFTDHAEFARRWNHDPRPIRGIGHGHTHFQELLHVPWAAWGPGVPAGTRRAEPVSLCDLTPTLLDWLGEDTASEDQTNGIESSLRGRSLAQAPAPDISEKPRIILAEAIAYGPDLVAVRKGDWKFIAHRDGRPLALFDLRIDPREKFDVSNDHEEVVAEFQELLARWRATGKGAGPGNEDAPESGAPKSWNDMDDTVRRRLKDLGYSD